MSKLKLGVIGVSNHFKKRCRIPLQQSEHVELYAVASSKKEKATDFATRYKIPKAYGSYDEILKDKAVDFVFIPLPNHLHLEWIKKSADAGKHILCEKPLTMNAKEAEEAVSYCKQKGVVLMEAFMYPFHPQWKRVKEIIDSGELGKVTVVSTFFSYNNKDAKNIRNIKEYGGGGLMDIGCYAISVPRFLMEKEPKRIVSMIEYDETFGIDKLTSALLDFGDARASFNIATQMNRFQRVEIHCTAGKVEVEIPFNTYPDVEVKVHVSSAVGDRTLSFGPADQYGLQFDAFARFLKGEDVYVNPPEDALNNMKAIDAVVRSAQSGAWELVK